jgi:hypothetical protein
MVTATGLRRVADGIRRQSFEQAGWRVVRTGSGGDNVASIRKCQVGQRPTRVKAALAPSVARAAFYEDYCCQALTISRGLSTRLLLAPTNAHRMGARNGGQDRASGERSSRSLYHREHALTLLGGASRTIRNVGELGPISEVRPDAVTRLLSVSAESSRAQKQRCVAPGTLCGVRPHLVGGSRVRTRLRPPGRSP